MEVREYAAGSHSPYAVIGMVLTVACRVASSLSKSNISIVAVASHLRRADIGFCYPSAPLIQI